MDELKIMNIQNIELNNDNSKKAIYLETKAIAILKVIDFLSTQSKLKTNPIEIIKQEFLMKYGTEKINDETIYKICISCLVDACKYLEKKLNINNDNILNNMENEV